MCVYVKIIYMENLKFESFERWQVMKYSRFTTFGTQKQNEESENETCRAHSHLCDVAVIRGWSRVSVAIGSGRQLAWTPWASTGPVQQASCLLSSWTIFSQLRARFAAPASTRWWCRKLPGSFCPAGTSRSTRSPRHLKQPQGIPEKSSSVRFVPTDVSRNGNGARDCYGPCALNVSKAESTENIRKVTRAQDFRRYDTRWCKKDCIVTACRI